jgi:hypothetical protein
MQLLSMSVAGRSRFGGRHVTPHRACCWSRLAHPLYWEPLIALPAAGALDSTRPACSLTGDFNARGCNLWPTGASRDHDTHRLHAMAPGLVGQTIEQAAGHLQGLGCWSDGVESPQQGTNDRVLGPR